jgi:hypothetical protein
MNKSQEAMFRQATLRSALDRINVNAEILDGLTCNERDEVVQVLSEVEVQLRNELETQ